MIKINLLPPERKKHEFPMWKIYKALAIFFLVLTVLVWGVSLAMYKYTSHKLEGINTQIASMKVWEDRYNKAQAQDEDIRKRNTIVTNLSKNMLQWGRFLAELGNATPAGCWLDNVRQTTGKTGDTLTVKGGSMQIDGVIDYNTRLQSLPGVSNAQIVDSSQAKKNNTAYYQFTLQLDRNGVAKK